MFELVSAVTSDKSSLWRGCVNNDTWADHSGLSCRSIPANSLWSCLQVEDPGNGPMPDGAFAQIEANFGSILAVLLNCPQSCGLCRTAQDSSLPAQISLGLALVGVVLPAVVRWPILKPRVLFVAICRSCRQWSCKPCMSRLKGLSADSQVAAETGRTATMMQQVRKVFLRAHRLALSTAVAGLCLIAFVVEAIVAVTSEEYRAECYDVTKVMIGRWIQIAAMSSLLYPSLPCRTLWTRLATSAAFGGRLAEIWCLRADNILNEYRVLLDLPLRLGWGLCVSLPFASSLQLIFTALIFVLYGTVTQGKPFVVLNNGFCREVLFDSPGASMVYMKMAARANGQVSYFQYDSTFSTSSFVLKELASLAVLLLLLYFYDRITFGQLCQDARQRRSERLGKAAMSFVQALCDVTVMMSPDGCIEQPAISAQKLLSLLSLPPSEQSLCILDYVDGEDEQERFCAVLQKVEDAVLQDEQLPGCTQTLNMNLKDSNSIPIPTRMFIVGFKDDIYRNVQYILGFNEVFERYTHTWQGGLAEGAHGDIGDAYASESSSASADFLSSLPPNHRGNWRTVGDAGASSSGSRSGGSRSISSSPGNSSSSSGGSKMSAGSAGSMRLKYREAYIHVVPAPPFRVVSVDSSFAAMWGYQPAAGPSNHFLSWFASPAQCAEFIHFFAKEQQEAKSKIVAGMPHVATFGPTRLKPQAVDFGNSRSRHTVMLRLSFGELSKDSDTPATACVGITRVRHKVRSTVDPGGLFGGPSGKIKRSTIMHQYPRDDAVATYPWDVRGAGSSWTPTGPEKGSLGTPRMSI